MKEIEIVTPEGVLLRFAVAHPFERAVAFTIDLVFQVLAALGIVLGALAVGGEISFVFYVVGVFVIRYGYFVYFETRWQGTTPGKRWVGLHVTSREGAGLSVEAIVARNLLRDFEVILPILALQPEGWLGPSPLWLRLPAVAWIAGLVALPFVTRHGLRAGDLVAGTAVVRLATPVLPTDEALSTQRAAAGAAPDEFGFTAAQLAIYGEHELETLADVLRNLDAGLVSKEALDVVVRTIARKIGFSEQEARRTPKRFLHRFYAAQRSALENRLLLGHRKASKHDRG